MTRKVWIIYFGVMGSFAAIVAATAWFVSGAAGANGDHRWVIATQAPVLAIVILWLITIGTSRKP